MTDETGPTGADPQQPRPPSTPDATPAPTTARAGSCPRAWAFLAVLTALLLAADLASKSWAFRAIADDPVVLDKAVILQVKEKDPGLIQALLPPHDPIVVVPSVLEFKLVLNAGAVFGAGAGGRWFFIAFTGVALAFAVGVFARWTAPRDRMAHAGVALVVAGGVGNLYDRVVFACVRDFIHPLPGVPLPFGLRWPGGGSDELWPYVSNVADAFLLVGIGLLLIRLWRDEPGAADGSPAPGAG